MATGSVNSLHPDHPEGSIVSKNTDARLSTTLPTHPKMKKMKRALGHAGPLGIIYLFLYVAAERPSGDLSGMTDDDIELAFDWDGEPGAFVAAAAAVGFLDGEAGARRIHDWDDHQPWASGAKERSDSARWAAFVQRHGYAGAAQRMPEYAKRQRPAGDPPSDPPAPTSPTKPTSPSNPSAPKPKATRARPAVGKEAYSASFERFWDAYPTQKRSKKLESWNRWDADKLDEFADTIIRDVEKRKAEHWPWIKDGGTFIPGAQVYLNGRRWNDAIEPVPPGGGGGRRSAIEHDNATVAEKWAENGGSKP